MLSKTFLASALLATVASAENFMVHAEMKRELLQPRQTAVSSQCESALVNIYSSVPTPPAAIISDIEAHPQTNPCSFSTPASLSKQYASYSSEVLSWYSANEDAISSALSECPILSSYLTGVDICSTEAGAAGGSSPASATAEATTTGGSSQATKTAATGGSSKATGTSGGSSAAASGSSASGSSSGTGTAAASASATGAADHNGLAAGAVLAAAGLFAVAAL